MTPSPLTRADRLLLGATLLCAAVWSTYRLADPDTFLHLAIGRGIVQTRAIPTVCEQTYIEPKPAYQDHEWLGQVALYVVERVGERVLEPLVATWRDPEAWPPLPAPAEQAGVIGLQIGVLVVVALVGWLVWRTARARGASVAAFVIVACLAIPTFRFRMVPRPHLATTLGTALFAYWLVCRPRRPWVRWGLLAAAMVLWVNAHGGFLTGIAMVAIGAIAEGMRRIKWLAPPDARLECAAEAAHGGGASECAAEAAHGGGASECVAEAMHGGGPSECAAEAAPGGGALECIAEAMHGGGPSECVAEAAPSGGVLGRAAPAARRGPVLVALVCVLIALFAALANPYGAEAFIYPFRLMGAEYFRTHIAEWQPPDFSSYLWPFWALFATALGAAVSSLRRRDWAAVGLVIAFGYLAVNSRRHLELLCVVGVPIVAAVATPLLTSVGQWRPRAALPRLRPLATAGIFCGVVGLATMAWREEDLYRPGWGEHPRAFPVRALDHIAATPGHSWMADSAHPVLCELSWSGYVAWRMPRVHYFIDGRNLEFGVDAYESYRRVSQGTARCDEVMSCILAYGAPPADLLSRWSDDAPFSDDSHRLAYAVIVPTPAETDSWSHSHWKGLETRYADHLLEYADDTCSLQSPEAYESVPGPVRVFLLDALGGKPDPWRARELREGTRSLLRLQDSDRARFALAEGLLEDDPTAARSELLVITRRSPAHWQSRARLGEILVKQGRVEEAVRWLREAVALRPDIPELQYNLGHACGQVEDWEGSEAAYAALLEMQPDNAMALANRAVALHNLGDDGEARKCIDRALAIEPANAEFQATRKAIGGGE